MIAVRSLPLLCLLVIAHAASAVELGRMFFTPAQRATLDNARKQNIRVEIGNENEQQSTTAAPVPQSVSVNGVIRRSDGKNTIWLNNRVVNEQQPGSMNAAVGKADNRVRLNVPESGRNVDLKVGQTVEIVSGTIEESYLRRPAAKPDVKPPPEGEKTGGGRGKSHSDAAPRSPKIRVRAAEAAGACRGQRHTGRGKNRRRCE